MSHEGIRAFDHRTDEERKRDEYMRYSKELKKKYD